MVSLDIWFAKQALEKIIIIIAIFNHYYTFLLLKGFERPSAIQQRAIRPIVQGHDVIAQSQSGTGKTAVFSIGVLQSLDLTSKETQALVLSPTRELAEQTQKVNYNRDVCNVSIYTYSLWFVAHGGTCFCAQRRSADTYMALIPHSGHPVSGRLHECPMPCLYWRKEYW